MMVWGKVWSWPISMSEVSAFCAEHSRTWVWKNNKGEVVKRATFRMDPQWVIDGLHSARRYGL